MTYTIAHNATAKAKLDAIGQAQAKPCLISACRAFLKTLDVATVKTLENLANEVTFNRRRYGKGNWYCWANHPVFDERPIDPYPAVKWSKPVLMAELAIRTDIVTATH
ncbi:hypothetical protein [Alteromonas australica]|uniref:hypothetical protein n=1 Tax=Alteromonas australica TaxID=589873 RepID=UPI002490B874|nr:hypothetical protein [Alteromonas australica]|tara:strand:- start:1154 stop:1477 length:324 start_codon:yes stop_codon:yes gene_type:complete